MSDVSTPANVSDITVKILESIRDEIRGLRGEVVELRREVVELRGEVVELRGETSDLRGGLAALTDRVEEGFASVNGELRSLNRRTGSIEREAAGTNQRLDAVLKIAGTHHTELEQRVTRIEDHLGLPRTG